MTKPRDYFTGKQEEFKRSEVQIAPYNPRKISPQQKATLKRSIRKYGVVGGITVNKQTMTIVGGNQKVTIMDEIMGYPEKDYALLAEAIDVDYKTEVELNLMLNSENAHGEWDDMKVRELLPDINYMDAGLTEEDLSLFGYDAMVKTEGEDDSLLDPFAQESENRKVPAPKEVQEEQRRQIEQNQIMANQQQEAQYQANKERMQQVKREVNTKAAEKALEAESYVMLSFDNIDNKERFMSTFGFIETDKVIKGEMLMKVAKRI